VNSAIRTSQAATPISGTYTGRITR
jgi:hypothetical protein